MVDACLPDANPANPTFVDVNSPESRELVQSFIGLVDSNVARERNDLLVLLGPSGMLSFAGVRCSDSVS
jgi:hypothetical protein